MVEAIEIDVKNNKKSAIKLNESIFGLTVDKNLIHEAYVAYQAGGRSGLASVKTRAEVRGGGRKPWKQKGTGRARAGTSSSPVWVGGGVTFGPQLRDYSKKLNKKFKRLALKHALSNKIGNIFVLKNIDLAGKTKEVNKLFSDYGIDNRVLLVSSNDLLNRAARNLENVSIISYSGLNVCDLVNNKNLVVVDEVLKNIEENLV